jgi:hypothetical protein
MLIGLQSVFNAPLGPELHQQIKAQGFDLQRVDAQLQDANEAAYLVQEVLDVGLVPLVIFQKLEQLQYLPRGTHVELWNEPNLYDHAPGEPNVKDPAVYRALVFQAHTECERLGLHLWAGSVSNFNQDGLTYLKALDPMTWPAPIGVSMHWYPHKFWKFPHPGFWTREAELQTFKTIIGLRHWGMSEFGFHTNAQIDLGFWRWGWSDYDVARFTADEWPFWERHGAYYAVGYQLNDGTDGQMLYGYRATYAPGSPWKLVASTVREYKASQHT